MRTNFPASRRHSELRNLPADAGCNGDPAVILLSIIAAITPSDSGWGQLIVGGLTTFSWALRNAALHGFLPFTDTAGFHIWLRFGPEPKRVQEPPQIFGVASARAGRGSP